MLTLNVLPIDTNSVSVLLTNAYNILLLLTDTSCVLILDIWILMLTHSIIMLLADAY